MCDPIKLFAETLGHFHNHSKWNDAIFGEIKRISNTKVGDVGQVFIEKLCQELSISFKFPIDKDGKRLNQSPWDIEINNVKLELKTATEDVNGTFQFNHIRYHRPYDGLLCLGVSPSNLYFGIWSKGEVTTAKAGTLVSMEKGANASYKLTKRPNQLHEIAKFSEVISKFIVDFKK